jgi:succinate dehydrogenase / fumarate reductase, flavoprotein subunit
MTGSVLDELRKPGSKLEGGVPDGDPATAWERRKMSYRLVSPLNRRKFTVIVIGCGLAGAGCAAALGELGFNVECFTYHDSPRRAHSIAAQGGINSPRAKKVDNDSILRFVKDTVEGGDFRSREADCFRLGQESLRVIDHMNAIGAPFAREYGGQLATRSFGGVQVSRTYYTRGQTGQQLEIAAAQALHRQIAKGTVRLHTRHEMLDLIVTDGVARGIVARDIVTGQVRPFTAHAVLLATGGYANVYGKSTNALNSNATAAFRAHRRGAYFASPCFIQFHPTTLPISSPWQSKRMLMSESLRNDAREWVPKTKGDDRPPNDIPDNERDYFLERRYPAFGNLVPRDVASRANALEIRDGHGVGALHNGVYLDLRDATARLGVGVIMERYGNLLDMYREMTGDDPLKVPMRIAPGAHFSMGGLWTDFDSMSNLAGLFVGGEAGWTYHGANRLGANSLLSACVDGWFTLPVSVPNYLESLLGTEPLALDDPAVTTTVNQVQAGVRHLLDIGGTKPADYFHRQLGDLLYDQCGVNRRADELADAIDRIQKLRKEFSDDLRVTGTGAELNQELEKAGRVSDFIDLGELMCIDALDRDESCGGHFRVEHQTPDGEAQRDDAHWCFVSAWERPTSPGPYIRHDEPLTFTAVPLEQRDYKTR